MERSAAEKEEDMILKEYLEGLKLQEGDEEELLLPDEDLPADYHLAYNRRCRRTIYPDGDFNIMLSKEVVYRMDGIDQDNVETVRITLLYVAVVHSINLNRGGNCYKMRLHKLTATCKPFMAEGIVVFTPIGPSYP